MPDHSNTSTPFTETELNQLWATFGGDTVSNRSRTRTRCGCPRSRTRPAWSRRCGACAPADGSKPRRGRSPAARSAATSLPRTRRRSRPSSADTWPGARERSHVEERRYTRPVRLSSPIVGGVDPGPSAPPSHPGTFARPPLGGGPHRRVVRPHAIAPCSYATSSAPRPRPPPSSPSTRRRSTRLFQYGGPRPGDRRGPSVASPAAARMPAMLAGSLI